MRNQILFMEKQPFGRCVCTISVLSSYQIEFLVKLENLYANMMFGKQENFLQTLKIELQN